MPLKDNSAVVSYLLEHAHCDPNCVANNGQTLLDIVRYPEHIRLLLKFGATPTDSQLAKWFPKQHLLYTLEPADMSINMFVLGNPGAGKSTLVKSLKTEGDLLSRIKHRFTQISDVDERTAGIIPHDICSKALGRMSLYDFAGHREFYAGHDALLQNSLGSSSIIALVIDMRGDEKQLRETLHYWYEFISSHSSKGRSKTHLVIIGSHVDGIPSRVVKEKSRFLELLTMHIDPDNISISGQVMLDCRYAESSSMSQLRFILAQSCQAFRSSEKVAATHHTFLLFLCDKFRDQPAVSISTVSAELKRSESSENYAYLNAVISSNLIEVCEILSNHGDILFMKNKELQENSWIVFDKAVLLSRVSGVIFAPEGFKEHQNLSTKTGIVSLSQLAALFPDLDSNMISQFLCHLEFCNEVIDHEILALLHASTTESGSDEKFFFFPGLVDLTIPTDVWLANAQFRYYSGWLLRCCRHDQFLSTRFLQVLLRRLAYNLAFHSSEQNLPASDLITLERNCCVWKCGISWSDRSGIEVVVEVINQKSVLVMIRSLVQVESLTMLTSVRSQIIRKVLDTKEELCPMVAVTDSLLHPEDARNYPVDPNKVRCVKISEIAHAVVEAKVGVMDSAEQMVDLKGGLLFFEPYVGMKRPTLDELFKADDHTSADDKFLYDIAECVHKSTDYSIEIFKPRPIRLANLMDRAPPGDVHKVVRVFQLWREEMGAEGTRCNLRKKFDQFSVFAGRNPIDHCPW